MENKNETVENSQEMIQRLFSMMENFASKLEVLEKEKDAKKWIHKRRETKEYTNDKYIKICKKAKWIFWKLKNTVMVILWRLLAFHGTVCSVDAWALAQIVSFYMFLFDLVRIQYNIIMLSLQPILI